ncbi:Mu transposase C-terminal domain-containing protein [Sulfurimonas sp.]
MSLTIQENSVVYRADEEFVITKVIDFNYVFAKNVQTLETVRLSIQDLSSSPISTKEPTYEDLSQIPEKKLEDAKKRYEIIKPLIGVHSRKEVEKRAQEFNMSPTTIYNWLKAYDSSGQLSSLVFLKVKGGKGKSRLSKEQDELIDIVIKEYYLTSLKPKIPRVYDELVLRCRNADIPVPSMSSLRRRIQLLSESYALKKRLGKKAVEKFEMNTGEYPDGLYPLHVLQIDHTRADIILVDDEYREEMGRPWITMVIDIYSRMVAGFYVSFETPGYFGTGQALFNAITPKEKLKEKYELKSEYPVWGIPNMIHMDNAKEFRGVNLQNVCNEYGINIVWRPVGKARYGAHIERLLGTLSNYIHTLDGTTFSNIQERGEYNSQKNATMTLSEFESWLTILIADVYHNQIHSALQMSPLQKYKEGIFGTSTQPPRGLPKRIEDEHLLYINLLPKEERTVQQYGIQIDNIYYYSEVLNAWIDSFEYIRGKKVKKKFIVRRDLRDISQIWFYRPQVNKYYRIPYRNPRLPKVSIWEYRAALKHLKKEDNREYNETEVFEALNRLREIALNSKTKTKAHRKAINRISKVEQIEVVLKKEKTDRQPHEVIVDGSVSWLEDEELVPFEHIDDLVEIEEQPNQIEHKSTTSLDEDNIIF